jgi:hypothetical protein
MENGRAFQIDRAGIVDWSEDQSPELEARKARILEIKQRRIDKEQYQKGPVGWYRVVDVSKAPRGVRQAVRAGLDLFFYDGFRGDYINFAELVNDDCVKKPECGYYWEQVSISPFVMRKFLKGCEFLRGSEKIAPVELLNKIAAAKVKDGQVDMFA